MRGVEEGQKGEKMREDGRCGEVGKGEGQKGGKVREHVRCGEVGRQKGGKVREYVRYWEMGRWGEAICCRLKTFLNGRPG
ncbi:hypothetical protein PoB_002916500 [Plakobranchus ocellatus]|uniref:Uncharacterized protein n=1 Tax=Plakobranchus ocellatus TaxID=259542 RepID=A0AAV4A5K8_9GAST|nr:hypothetical protein PoB_002916500 [Plakobranchus ocellatus]